MANLNIGIICGPENGSPKVLAETLDQMVIQSGHNSEIFYRAKAFKRLLHYSKVKYNFFLWYLFKLKYFFGDRKLFSKLNTKDAIIICDWTPNAFYKDTYDIQRLRKILKDKPILYYAVQFLHNSPTIIEKLKSGNHATLDRYDWHLAVSSITELRGTPTPPWNQIGLNLKSTGLKPEPKEEFFAIVDFLRPGFESYRELQIKVLKELDIPYISLENEYSLSDIRELYKKASIFFIQFPEAYGLPIAESLACGSYIGTPDSSWAMSWRLDDVVEVHGPGKLPECFVVYKDEKDLKKQLQKLKIEFDSEGTPRKVFEIFYKHYPTFYEGNYESLNEVFNKIENKTLKFNYIK